MTRLCLSRGPTQGHAIDYDYGRRDRRIHVRATYGFQLVNQLVIIYWFSTGKATGKSTGNINWSQMSTGISTGFQIVSTGINWYQLRPVDTS